MHISLYVSDIENTTKFYNTFFGIKPAKVKSDYAKYILESPSLVISFVQNLERVQTGFGHLGFQVETQKELELRHNIASLQNLISSEELALSCYYAVQDKFWVSDPDGYRWEVYYFHQDAEFIDPRFQDNNSENGVCCVARVQSVNKPANANSSCC